MVEIVGYSDATIELLAANLPENYDLIEFPVELLRKLKLNVCDYKLFMLEENTKNSLIMDINNSNDNNKITGKCQTLFSRTNYYSPDHNQHNFIYMEDQRKILFVGNSEVMTQDIDTGLCEPYQVIDRFINELKRFFSGIHYIGMINSFFI